ncbi:MAG: ExbD/TolR family protein [Deltaproteobacteria bacterium]
MSASIHSSEQAEPNLTPILDMVFQLITFFMLVINFQAAALDMSLKLPVVGSARPVETQTEDLMVLNVNNKGQLRVTGQTVDAETFLKKEAAFARKKLEQQEGKKINPGDELPTLVVVRADQKTSFDLLNKVLTECQKHGYRKFALRAMNRAAEAKS